VLNGSIPASRSRQAAQIRGDGTPHLPALPNGLVEDGPRCPLYNPYALWVTDINLSNMDLNWTIPRLDN
jgi:hypothetical protein